MDSEEIRNRYMQVFHRLGRIRLDPFFRDISQAEFMPLQKIHCFSLENPQAKGLYVSEIAAQLKVSSPAVSRTLRSLEEKELIERIPDKKDRRNTFIRLTDKGEKTRQEVFSDICRYFDDVFARMGGEDMESLISLVERLSFIMEDEVRRKKASCTEGKRKTEAGDITRR